MQISVTGRHVDITDAIRVYAQDEVTDKLGGFPRVEYVHIILGIEKHRHLAEVVVQAKNHIRLEADYESDDMYQSIDSAVEKAERQLRKLRDKIQDHKSKPKLVDLEPAEEA